MELNTADERDLHNLIRRTRDEPGISLEKIAEIIVDNFDKSEVDALISQLNKKSNN